MASPKRHRADKRRDRHGDPHDKGDKHRKPKRHKKKTTPPAPATEQIKADSRSVTTGQQDPTRPENPADDQSVFTTGPGQAVEYHYHRVGTYADDFAAQQNLAQFESQERAPNIAGPGEVVTSGAANNPT